MMEELTVYALIGIIITIYAFYVEYKAKKNIKVMCDINDKISCSKALTSDYSRLIPMLFKLDKTHPLNLPNTIFGFIFYTAVLLYNTFPFDYIPFRSYLLLIASSLSIIVSLILGYILIFKLRTFCGICVATYIVNTLIWGYARNECNI